MKILVIEDNDTIAHLLKVELEKWQYEVTLIQDFSNILEEFIEINPHLVLLDLRLPSFNGYHWCNQIRLHSKVPIMVISSQSDQMNQIMAIQMGADDFIAKPFDMGLTIAKIQALLRRTYDFVEEQASMISYQNVQLSLSEAKLFYKDHTIDLTHTELQIMEALMRAKGKYVSREQIMEKCWQESSFIDDNTLSVNITRLRKKLESIDQSLFIQSKRNVGYLFTKGEA